MTCALDSPSEFAEAAAPLSASEFKIHSGGYFASLKGSGVYTYKSAQIIYNGSDISNDLSKCIIKSVKMINRNNADGISHITINDSGVLIADKIGTYNIEMEYEGQVFNTVFYVNEIFNSFTSGGENDSRYPVYSEDFESYNTGALIPASGDNVITNIAAGTTAKIVTGKNGTKALELNSSGFTGVGTVSPRAAVKLPRYVESSAVNTVDEYKYDMDSYKFQRMEADFGIISEYSYNRYGGFLFRIQNNNDFAYYNMRNSTGAHELNWTKGGNYQGAGFNANNGNYTGLSLGNLYTNMVTLSSNTANYAGDGVYAAIYANGGWQNKIRANKFYSGADPNYKSGGTGFFTANSIAQVDNINIYEYIEEIEPPADAGHKNALTTAQTALSARLESNKTALADAEFVNKIYGGNNVLAVAQKTLSLETGTGKVTNGTCGAITSAVKEADNNLTISNAELTAYISETESLTEGKSYTSDTYKKYTDAKTAAQSFINAPDGKDSIQICYDLYNSVNGLREFYDGKLPVSLEFEGTFKTGTKAINIDGTITEELAECYPIDKNGANSGLESKDGSLYYSTLFSDDGVYLAMRIADTTVNAADSSIYPDQCDSIIIGASPYSTAQAGGDFSGTPNNILLFFNRTAKEKFMLNTGAGLVKCGDGCSMEEIKNTESTKIAAKVNEQGLIDVEIFINWKAFGLTAEDVEDLRGAPEETREKLGFAVAYFEKDTPNGSGTNGLTLANVNYFYWGNGPFRQHIYQDFYYNLDDAIEALNKKVAAGTYSQQSIDEADLLIARAKRYQTDQSVLNSEKRQLMAEMNKKELTPAIISVDVNWSEMQFEYNVDSWNSVSHEYADISWSHADSANTVDITNNSDVGIKSTLTYSSESGFDGVNAVFESGGVQTNEMIFPVGNVTPQSKTASLSLDGTIPISLLQGESTKIGSVTVTIDVNYVRNN